MTMKDVAALKIGIPEFSKSAVFICQKLNMVVEEFLGASKGPLIYGKGLTRLWPSRAERVNLT